MSALALLRHLWRRHGAALLLLAAGSAFFQWAITQVVPEASQTELRPAALRHGPGAGACPLRRGTGRQPERAGLPRIRVRAPLRAHPARHLGGAGGDGRAGGGDRPRHDGPDRVAAGGARRAGRRRRGGGVRRPGGHLGRRLGRHGPGARGSGRWRAWRRRTYCRSLGWVCSSSPARARSRCSSRRAAGTGAGRLVVRRPPRRLVRARLPGARVERDRRSSARCPCSATTSRSASCARAWRARTWRCWAPSALPRWRWPWYPSAGATCDPGRVRASVRPPECPRRLVNAVTMLVLLGVTLVLGVVAHRR